MDNWNTTYSVPSSKATSVGHTGHIGRRGTIVLSAATRRRYGLDDGSLFISEERDDGILIRPAVAIPTDVQAVRLKVQVGIDQLNRGEGIRGEKVEAELKRVSREFHAKKDGSVCPIRG